MTTYKPISCHLYDYIEIACMHRYSLEIKLIDGKELIGNALNTVITDKVEFIVVEIDGIKRNIRLDLIKTFSALDNSAVFKTITLT